MFDITFDVARDTVTPMLDGLQTLLGSPAQHVYGGAEAVRQFLIEYHQGFEEKWKGSSYMSGYYSGQWAPKVADGWQPPIVFDDFSFTLENDAPYFHFKVYGGTIVPLNAQALTIPLEPEAKGVSAREYEGNEGYEIFIPKGKNVLARKGDGRGEIIPVYALVKSVTQNPWPGAMPDDETLSEVFAAAVQSYMDANILPS